MAAGLNVVDTMIFFYWHGAQHDLIREAISSWRSHFSDFKVLVDSDIEPIIAKRFPKYLEPYQKIRMPACKSDIARLVALHEWGGLYVDCHCGVGDRRHIRQLLENLDTFELIVVDEDPKYWPPAYKRPAVNPMNGIMFARNGSEIIFEWQERAFRGLWNQYTIEKMQGFCPYNIWSLTGAGHLRQILIDGEGHGLKMRIDQRVKSFRKTSLQLLEMYTLLTGSQACIGANGKPARYCLSKMLQD